MTIQIQENIVETFFMIHKEISDAQWSAIAPQLPKPAKTGRPRHDDGTTINGVLFVLTTGCRWADMPDKYGSKSTAHLRFQELRQKGIWKRILSRLIKSAHRQGKIDLQKISIGSSSIASKKGAMKQDMTDSGRFQARGFMSQWIRRDCRSQLGPVPQMSMTVRNSLTCWKTFQNWQVMIWDVRLLLHMQVRAMMQNASETI